MTMFDPRTKLSEQVVEEVRRFFGDIVYDAIIPRTVRLSEAPGLRCADHRLRLEVQGCRVAIGFWRWKWRCGHLRRRRWPPTTTSRTSSCLPWSRRSPAAVPLVRGPLEETRPAGSQGSRRRRPSQRRETQAPRRRQAEADAEARVPGSAHQGRAAARDPRRGQPEREPTAKPAPKPTFPCPGGTTMRSGSRSPMRRASGRSRHLNQGICRNGGSS